MITRIRTILSALCFWATALTGAEKNVIFFITDDESPTLGCYGDPVAKTPAIDALAKDGTLFLNAYATTASCSASRSVVMSGLHNHANGQYGHQHNFHKFASYYNASVSPFRGPWRTRATARDTSGSTTRAPEEVFHYQTYLKGSTRNAVQMAEQSRPSSPRRAIGLSFSTSPPPTRTAEEAGTRPRSVSSSPTCSGTSPTERPVPGLRKSSTTRKSSHPLLPSRYPETREELAYYQSVSRIDQGWPASWRSSRKRPLRKDHDCLYLRPRDGLRGRKDHGLRGWTAGSVRGPQPL